MEANQPSGGIRGKAAFSRVVSLAVLILAVSFSGLVQSAPLRVAKISVSEFEEQPVEIYRRIESAGDRTQILSGPGETRIAAVRVFDGSDNVIADPAIDWSSSDLALLSVSSTAADEVQLQGAASWHVSLNDQTTSAPRELTAACQTATANLLRQTLQNVSTRVLENLDS